MSNKTKKIITVVLLVLAALIAAAVIVCYNIWPEPTKQWLNTAWEWLNKPLPVVSCSTLVLGFFIIKVLATSSFGKKQINLFQRDANSIRSQYELLKEEYTQFKSDTEAIINSMKEELDKYREGNREVCLTIPNKKVKAIGEKYYGKKEERIDNEAEAE